MEYGEFHIGERGGSLHCKFFAVLLCEYIRVYGG